MFCEIKVRLIRSYSTLILGLTLTAFTGLAWAEYTEVELKAALILNFAKYVEWPANSLNDTPGKLTMCMVGKRDALFDKLTAMEGKIVNDLSLRVRAADRNDNLMGCHVLVLAESEAEHFEKVLRPLVGTPVLTVNGSSRFLEAGGIISLIVENNKVRFDINLSAARRNKSVMSSNLLKLVRQVRQL